MANKKTSGEKLENLYPEITGVPKELYDYMKDSTAIPTVKDFRDRSSGYSKNAGSIFNVKGKDDGSNEVLSRIIDDKLIEYGEKITPSTLSSLGMKERVDKYVEINYIISNFPQAEDAISRQVTRVMSPDMFTILGSDIKFDEEKLKANDYTSKELLSMLGLDKDTDLDVVDTVVDFESKIRGYLIKAKIYGFQPVAVIPTKEIAMGILNNSEKSKSFNETLNSFEESIRAKKLDKYELEESIGMFKESVMEAVTIDKCTSSLTETFLDKESALSHVLSKEEANDILSDILTDNMFPTEMKNDVLVNFSESINSFEEEMMAYTNEQNMSRNESRGLRDIKGIKILELDVTKCIPISNGDDKILGMYYIETNEANKNAINSNMVNALGHSSLSAGNADGYKNNVIEQAILGDLKKLINKNISKKFLVNNSTVIDDIEDVISNNPRGYKVRFIPGEYIVNFRHGEGLYGQPSILKVKNLALMWILLSKDYIVSKLFHEKIKSIIKYKRVNNTSTDNLVMKALEGLKRMVPSFAEISDMTAMNSIGNRNRIMLPTNKNGEDVIDLSNQPGRNASIDMEFLDKLELIVTSSVGMPSSLSDPTVKIEYAAQFRGADEDANRQVIKDQKDYTKSVNELLTLISRGITGISDLKTRFSFIKPRSSESDVTRDMIDAAYAKVDKIMEELSVVYSDKFELIPTMEAQVKKAVLKQYTAAFVDWDFLEDIINTVEITESAMAEKE